MTEPLKKEECRYCHAKCVTCKEILCAKDKHVAVRVVGQKWYHVDCTYD